MKTIQDIKQYYGQDAERIISSGMSLTKKNSKYHCPNHSAHKNNDSNPSMSWDRNALQFYCFTCKKKIDIYSYLKEHEGLSHSEILQGIDTQVHQNNNSTSLDSYTSGDLTDIQYRYLSSRGIVSETAAYFGLFSLDGNIGIPYRDESGFETGVKIKNLKGSNPKYFSVKGSCFGLYNKNNLTLDEPLILTEGEFDAMIVYQSGYKNVSSVGTGAKSLTKLFEKEENFLLQQSSIIILSDNDSYGEDMKKFFINKLKYRIKLPQMSHFKGFKDINEVYLNCGISQVEKIIKSAISKIEGLRDLDLEPYKGLEGMSSNFIPTGLPSIDYALNDLMPGTLTLVTGRSNGGKSTLVNQVIANAIDKNNKVFLINGEGDPELLINSIYKAVIGKEDKYYKTTRINKRDFIEPRDHVKIALQKWHKNKLMIFNKGESPLKSTEELFELISVETKSKGFNLIVLDNLMSLLSVTKASDKWDIQSDFIQKLSDLAKIYKSSIILVLHPSKALQKGQTMDFEHIAGSSDIYNKADAIISVTRSYDDHGRFMNKDGEIELLKNRYLPDLVKIDTHYDRKTGLVLEIDSNSGCVIQYNFHWQKYLGNLVEQETIDIPEGFYEIQVKNSM